MGTPQFAVPSLVMLKKAGYNIKAVITQPDKPVGRKKEFIPSPIKENALLLGLNILQPENFKDQESINQIKDLEPDYIVVAAYGKIIPKAVLDIPKKACINIHPSMLSKYRGASPIQTALLNGDTKTGVTIMLMDEGMDTGDILLQHEFDIGTEVTNKDLQQSLSRFSARLLLQTLQEYTEDKIKPIKQDDSQATYTKIIKKQDGLIDWSKSAQDIYNQYRAFQPWPGVFTYLDNKRVKLILITKNLEFRMHPVIRQGAPSNDGAESYQDGLIIIDNNKMFVKCGDDSFIEVLELQMEGKKPMNASDFIKGNDVDNKNFSS
jgi:methionyl-tRNA formyltransferase